MLFSRRTDAARPPAASPWALPSLCAVCHGWGRARVCSTCIGSFTAAKARCERCAIEVPPGAVVCGRCLRVPPAHDRCIAAVDYGYPWDGLVTAFKFHAALDLAPVLAALLRSAVAAAGAPRCDLVVPVPLSRERLRERGYNQAWELARRLRLGPADPRLLLRLRDTEHQARLALGRRSANVRGAFLVEPSRVPALRGATIAVVDDVMTSGSTLDEIARCLKQAGAASVQAWVLARTPKDEA